MTTQQKFEKPNLSITPQQQIQRYKDLLKIRQQDYEMFGETSRDAQYDVQIKKQIKRLQKQL